MTSFAIQLWQVVVTCKASAGNLILNNTSEGQSMYKDRLTQAI